MDSEQPIVVLVEGLDKAYAAILNGLKRYRDKLRMPWHIQACSHGEEAHMPAQAAWVMRTAGTVQNVIDKAKHPILPLCTLFGSESDYSRPACTLLENSFGWLAAQHIAERGYKHACTIDISVRHRFDDRRAGFRAGCDKFGIDYEHYIRDRTLPWQDIDANIRSWLRSRTSHTVFYGVIDAQAIWLRDMLLSHGVSIPEEVSVLGTGDHVSTCIRQEPELCSVSYPWSLLGEAAAHNVHHQLAGDGPQPPQQLRAYRVTERKTCPHQGPQDPLVAKAMSWLERHIDEQRPLAALVSYLQMSDPQICRRFKKDIGSSPKQAQEQIRLQKANLLLSTTTLSINEIARRVGYRDTTAFGVAFKRRRGCTPSNWRAALGNS